jgi:hypothetical protein
LPKRTIFSTSSKDVETACVASARLRRVVDKMPEARPPRGADLALG